MLAILPEEHEWIQGAFLEWDLQHPLKITTTGSITAVSTTHEKADVPHTVARAVSLKTVEEGHHSSLENPANNCDDSCNDRLSRERRQA